MALNGLLPGVLHRYSEFIYVLTGACGPNSLSMARDWATQTYAGNRTPNVVNDLQNWGILPANSNGVSDPAQIHAGAVRYGLKVAFFQDWEQPDPTWQAEADAQLDAGNIVICFVHNGQALVDWKTGNGENASHLQNHVICLCGKWAGGLYAGAQRPQGYWALDGDNYDIGDMTQYYPLSVVANALPSAIIGIASTAVAPAPIPAPTGGTMIVPTGWHDDGTTLTDPKGKRAVQGFRDHILNWDKYAGIASGWPASNTIVEEDVGFLAPVEQSNPGLGGGARITFLGNGNGIVRLEWTEATGVIVGWAGRELVYIEQALHTERTQNTQLAQQVQALQNEIANQPVPVPAFDPTETEAALAAIAADLASAASDLSRINVDLAKVTADLSTASGTLPK